MSSQKQNSDVIEPDEVNDAVSSGDAERLVKMAQRILSNNANLSKLTRDNATVLYGVVGALDCVENRIETLEDVETDSELTQLAEISGQVKQLRIDLAHDLNEMSPYLRKGVDANTSRRIKKDSWTGTAGH